MPNYEYECTKDQSRFEIWQEAGSPPPPCPTCGADTKKIFHVPRVIFKGSGFYVTDLRSEQGKNGGSDDKAEAKTETKSESGGDAKTETPKTETKIEAPKSDSKGDSKTDAPASAKPATGKPATGQS